MTKHGGERIGAGRPEAPLHDTRIMHLFNQGASQREIAKKFGVSQPTIGYRIAKLKKQS